jgi:hypothetical protein
MPTEQSRQVVNQGAMPAPQSEHRPDAVSEMASGSNSVILVAHASSTRAASSLVSPATPGKERSSVCASRAAAAACS